MSEQQGNSQRAGQSVVRIVKYSDSETQKLERTKKNSLVLQLTLLADSIDAHVKHILEEGNEKASHKATFISEKT